MTGIKADTSIQPLGCSEWSTWQSLTDHRGAVSVLYFTSRGKKNRIWLDAKLFCGKTKAFVSEKKRKRTWWDVRPHSWRADYRDVLLVFCESVMCQQYFLRRSIVCCRVFSINTCTKTFFSASPVPHIAEKGLKGLKSLFGTELLFTEPLWTWYRASSRDLKEAETDGEHQ